MTDKIMGTIMILAAIVTILIFTFEMGKKNMCEKLGNFYSIDLSSCISPKELNDFIKR